MKRKTTVIWFHIFGMTGNVAMVTWIICVIAIFVDAFTGRNLKGTTLGFLIATAGYAGIGLQVVCYIGMNIFGDAIDAINIIDDDAVD